VSNRAFKLNFKEVCYWFQLCLCPVLQLGLLQTYSSLWKADGPTL